MAIIHRDKYYENKKKIIDCFFKICNEQGYNNTTICKISKITNLSYGSITNIFATKEDILLEILKDQILYYSNHTKKELRLNYFLKVIIYQLRNLLVNDQNKVLLLELFSLAKTSTYLKMHVKDILMDSISINCNHQLKAAAIIGLIREYINIFDNHKTEFDIYLHYMLESILLLCEYNKKEANEIINKLLDEKC